MRNTLSRLLSILAVAGLLATAGQAQVAPNDGGPAPAPGIKLTMQDQHVLKENLLKSAATSGAAAEVKLEEGARVPPGVQLQQFPEEIATKIPAIKSHEYFVVNSSIAIVRPQERTIVAVVKATPPEAPQSR